MNASLSNFWSVDKPPRLLASRHRESKEVRFPPFRPGCPLASWQEVVSLDGVGIVYSFSVIHPNPKSGTKPYALGYIDVPGPVRIFGRIQGDAVEVGSRCEAVPDDEFGYHFKQLNV